MNSIWIARDVRGRMQGEVTMFVTKPVLEQGIWRGKVLCFVEAINASVLTEEIRPGECREFEWNGLGNPYDPNFGDDKLCQCGHRYERHFDGFEDNAAVGCKYCECREFVAKEASDDA